VGQGPRQGRGMVTSSKGGGQVANRAPQPEG
jgi:hypothetical protein